MEEEKYKIEKRRDDEDLHVAFTAHFTIPYQGSSDWLESLKEFIEKHSV